MAMLESAHVWFRSFRDELSLRGDNVICQQIWREAVSPKKALKLGAIRPSAGSFWTRVHAPPHGGEAQTAGGRDDCPHGMSGAI